MSKVFDFYSRHPSGFLQQLKDEGAAGIARYLTEDPGDPRAVSKAEITDAHGVGLAVHFVYEMNPTNVAYFTPAQGTLDATNALGFLDHVGAPNGTVVYFAVDTNLDPEVTIPYFNAVDTVLQGRSGRALGGIYGFQRMVDFARANFGNLGKHLWQTYGAVTGPLDLWQNEQEAIGGVEVDVSECWVTGWAPARGEGVTRDEYIKVEADGLSLEDRVKATIRVVYAAEIAPTLQAEINRQVAMAIAASRKRPRRS